MSWRVRGRGTARKEADGMNKTERAYAFHLSLRQKLGQIEHFAFESVKLRLADRTFYTPDFFVMLPDGAIELHEVKGFWEDDARVKIKVAAEIFPFTFRAVKPAAGGQWSYEDF